MAEFTLFISLNASDLPGFFRGIQYRIDHPKPLYDLIGKYLVDRTKSVHFKNQTDPEGRPWADLKPATWKRKRETRGIMKILQEKGYLRATIAYQATDEGVDIGSPLPYAAIHQFGGTVTKQATSRMVGFKIGKDGSNRFSKASKATILQPVNYGERQFNVPARPFIGIGAADEEPILERIVDYLLLDNGLG